MKNFKDILPKAIGVLLVMTVICGVIYTGLITGVAKLFFNDKSNGSIIEVNGKKYGSVLLAQKFSDKNHMWGRVMNVSASVKDEDGNMLMYSSPSNLSPESEEFKKIVEDRVNMILEADPSSSKEKIPEDLVTCSGSGLDPEISFNAAAYQVERLAKNNNMSESEVEDIIQKCTINKIAGIFGEKTVNVLKVNLMLDGII